MDNMATTLNTSELLRIIPQPKKFSIEMDVEEFLSEMRNYFNIIQINEEQRNILIRAFMDEDSRKQFEKNVEGTIFENYEDKFRRVFVKTTNLAEDLQNALAYRKGTASIDEYIRQIEKNVEKVMKHKLTSTKLTAFLLKYCLDDEKMREEVSRFEYTETLLKLKSGKDNSEIEDQKGPTPTKYIKEILKTVEARTRQDEVLVMNRPSYAAMTQKNGPYNQQQFSNRREYHEPNRRPQIIYREVTKPNPNLRQLPRYEPQCYTCREFGHIQRNCQNDKLLKCHRNGHSIQQCYFARRDNDRFNDRGAPVRSNSRQTEYYRQRRTNSDDRIAAMNNGESRNSEFEERDSKNDAEQRYRTGDDLLAGNGHASDIGEMLGAIQTQ